MNKLDEQGLTANKSHTWILSPGLLKRIIRTDAEVCPVVRLTCTERWVPLQVWTAPPLGSTPVLRWCSRPRPHTTPSRTASGTQRIRRSCRRTCRHKQHYQEHESTQVCMCVCPSWCDYLKQDRQHNTTLFEGVYIRMTWTFYGTYHDH